MSTRHDDTASLVDPGSQKRIDEVADALRRRGGSATSAELASDLGIHPSTARFHLDRLVEQGRVKVARRHRATRGRPHTVFTLVSDEGPRAYRLLAQMLVDEVALSDNPTAMAIRIGQRWGRHRRGDLIAVLDDMGFSPAAEEAASCCATVPSSTWPAITPRWCVPCTVGSSRV